MEVEQVKNHRNSNHLMDRSWRFKFWAPVLLLAMGSLGCEEKPDPPTPNPPAPSVDAGTPAPNPPADAGLTPTVDGGANAALDAGTSARLDAGSTEAFDAGPTIVINACTLGTDLCDMNAICSGLEDGYTCACTAGYEGDGRTDGTGCTNIDECATQTHNCDVNANCFDIEPFVLEEDNRLGFYCICKNGWEGNGVACLDINECAEGIDTCDMNATCSNTEGGFGCGCNDFFTGDGTTCTEIPMSEADNNVAGKYLMTYRLLREAIAFGSYDEDLDLNDDGILSVLDIVAARCAAHSQTSGAFFEQLDLGCPITEGVQEDLFNAVNSMAETECTTDADCQGQAPGSARCTDPDVSCRCLRIGRSNFSECQPQY